MPKLSDTMTEGVVAQWLKKVGDPVKSGEILAEIETDKATMEFESFYDGVLLHIGVEKGQGAPVDSILAIIGKKGEDISGLLGSSDAPAAKAPEQKGQAEASQESKPEEKQPEKKQEVPATTAQQSYSDSDGRLKASPLAKRLAADKGIDISRVPGSGDNGRIVKRDIENYTPSAGGYGQPSFSGEAYFEEPVSQMRKTIAKRLAESKFSAPHFYLTIDIDMDNAMAARKAINDNGDVKISFNDMVIKSVAAALRKHPKINASWLGDKIRYNNEIHIGVAVAVPDGLLVPVVRNADLKGMSRIGEEVKDFAQRAKDKKLQPSDWEGNTFTISNLGMFGIEQFTAIINPPDACILAIGGIRQVPVVKNNQVVPGNMMKVTLSSDHRVVDGATAAAFLQDVKRNLENPVMMLV
jgi:pyruvate dehydrogenase E2 component (dihydrolipoamide acetyltransferase)